MKLHYEINEEIEKWQRPNRDKVISQDEILNLKIVLETCKDADSLIEAINGL